MIDKKEQILGKVKERLEKEKTMNLSIKEGSASSVMSGFTDSYVTPYALTLGANNLQIGLLSSISSLLSPLSQLAGSKLMEKYSRKRIITIFVALQALMWLPIVFLAIFFWKSVFLAQLPFILIAFYSLYAIFGAMAGPAWFSLLGDIVPEKIRGKYFGKRNKICGAVGLLSTLVAAFLLDYFKTHGLILLGFSILFIIAAIARLIASFLFTKHYEPKLKLEKGYYFSFWQFVKKAPGNNFGKFTIFVALINLVTNIAGPFFAVYMLKSLGFSYITFMLMNISGAVASLLFMPIWGKFSDKFGNRELLRVGSVLIPLVPVLWIFSTSPWFLAIPQIISGIGWAAFNLAAGNFIYDSVTPQRRAICVTYYNMINGVCLFIGAGIGGLMTQYITLSFMNIFLFAFLVSGVLRAVIAIIMLPSIKEVRSVEKTSGNALVYMKEINPIKEFFTEVASDAKALGKVVSGKKVKY